MDVQGSPADPAGPGDTRGEHTRSVQRVGWLSSERVGRALGEWQRAELRLARSFPQCRELAHEQLEDIYQETTLALLGLPFHNEEHLRNALRWGIKHRALHLHRDQRRRGEILLHRAPELELAAEAREEKRAPELAALLSQDRLIVAEFLTELTPLERNVFWMMAEGMRYRAIAPMLGVPVNEARKASRSCERKRQRFQLLYDTGRLCGYRGHTIRALQAGESAREELVLGAYAHLEFCAQCRAEHRTNARRLRRSFQGQAAALLPVPLISGHLGWLARVDLRLRGLAQRLIPYTPPPGGGGAREGAVAMLAGGGVAIKLAAAGASVVVLAGGTLGVTHVLQGGHGAPRHTSRHTLGRPRSSAAGAPAPVLASSAQASGTGSAARRPASDGQGAPGARASGASREPGGFAFLGVPQRTPQRAVAPAHTAGAGTGGSTGGEAAGATQSGGGPFSP